MEIPLGAVMRRGQVLGKKNVDGQRLRERRHHLLARFGNRVNPVSGQVNPEKECNTGHINQDNDNQVCEKFDIISRSILQTHVFSPQMPQNSCDLFKPKLSDFLLDLHQFFAHQASTKILDISAGMPVVFANPYVSRSRHIFSPKIAQLRLKLFGGNRLVPAP